MASKDAKAVPAGLISRDAALVAPGQSGLLASALGLNPLRLALDRFLGWEFGTYREIPSSQPDLFLDGGQAGCFAADLASRYDLTEPQAHACETRYRETLTYLLWLDTLLNLQPQWFSGAFSLLGNPDEEPFRWLDVGAKNWSYVAALTSFIQSRPDEFWLGVAGRDNYRLDGVELDTRRRYTNLKTRSQAAQCHIRHWPNAHYHGGNILGWHQEASVISCFLPFVFQEPHLAWGLPKNTFNPPVFLAHLLSLLPPQGLLLVVNQGEDEAAEQELLFQAASKTCPIRWQSAGQLPAPFIEYQYPRFGWICQRQ